MVVKEAVFSHEEFMNKLGLRGDFEAIRNIIASMKEPCPRIEVIYHSLESAIKRDE